jgi:uncharacterized protein YoxC
MTMTIAEKSLPNNAHDQTQALTKVLDQLNHTFAGFNITMEKIQQGHDFQKSLQNRKIKILGFMAVAIVLVIVALGMHMFYVVHTMQQIMTNMSEDMGAMRQYMEEMTGSMSDMTSDIGKMTVQVTGMGELMESMSTEMHNVSSDLRKMSGNMRQMSGDMGQIAADMQYLRKATVAMESSTRSMTRKVNEMSNTVSPVMEGARQFMPFVPWGGGGRNRYPRR